MKTPITHVQQTEPNGCTSACLAMLTGQPVRDVMGAFHEAYRAGKTTAADYLLARGVMLHTPPAAEAATLLSGYAYLAILPSLATPGLLHNVVIDCRDGELKVYDPSMGLTRYYVAPGDPRLDKELGAYDENAFPLLSWVNECVISPAHARLA